MSSINHVKLVGVTAAVLLASVVIGLSDARAAFNVKQFSCTTDPFGVKVDVSGLGNTNLCVEGATTLNLFCACVSNSGSCPQNAAKQTFPFSSQAGQSVEPKNGRVNTTFTLPLAINDSLCTEPACGEGQTVKLIEWNTSPPTGSPATFRVCTTTQPAGQACTCDDPSAVLDTTTCGPTSDVVFSGKNNSCLKLFQ